MIFGLEYRLECEIANEKEGAQSDTSVLILYGDCFDFSFCVAFTLYVCVCERKSCSVGKPYVSFLMHMCHSSLFFSILLLRAGL